MTRETFERDLRNLQNEVMVMGSLVEKAITESAEHLKRKDLEGARRLIAEDRRVINDKYFAIETEALTLIATQQPMAGDLRTIAAVLEIAHELERMGDYAKGIAKIVLMVREEPFVDISPMAEKVRHMLHRALEAFIVRDVDLARAIPREDDEVDTLYSQIYRELLTFVLADPQGIDRAIYLLWAAHHLERAADRVTNICERVIFTVTGEKVELDIEDQGLEGIE